MKASDAREKNFKKERRRLAETVRLKPEDSIPKRKESKFKLYLSKTGNTKAQPVSGSNKS